MVVWGRGYSTVYYTGYKDYSQSMKEYQNFTWKKNKLYEGDILWATLIPDKTHSGMWKIEWAGDGSLSMDMFNKARCKDNAQKMACFLSNKMRELGPRLPP